MAKANDQSVIKSSKESNNWNIGHSVKAGNSQNDVGEYVSDNSSNKKKRKRKSKSKSEGMLDRLRGSLKVRANMLKKVKKSDNLEHHSGNDSLQGDTDTEESQLETLHEDFSLNVPMNDQTVPKSYNSTINSKFNRRPSLAGSRRISMRSVSDSDITSISEDSVFRPELPLLNRKASIRTTLNKMGYDIKPKKAPSIVKELTNDELDIIDQGVEDISGLRKQSLNSRMIMRTQLKGGRSKLDPVNKTKAQVLTLETINSADDLESLNKRAKLPNISQQHTKINQSSESTLQGRLSRQQSFPKDIGMSSTESTFTGRLSRKESLVRRTSVSSLVSSHGSEDNRHQIGRRSSIVGKNPTSDRRKSVKDVFNHVATTNTITSMISRRRDSKGSQDASSQDGNLIRRRSSIRLTNVLGAMNKKRLDRKTSVSDGLVGIVQTKHEMARRKRRIQLGLKFKRIARFLLKFLRLCAEFHERMKKDVLRYVDAVSMMADEIEAKNSLLFDVTDFKADKESRAPSELVKLLKKPSYTRTEGEIRYIQIALQNYKSIVEYPKAIQSKIAECAWYESYSAKRVIVREGHTAMGFYFVLSGSAMVSAMDRKKEQAKTLHFLNRGDSFGEAAIVNSTKREATVISKQQIELMAIAAKDFINIFMSGGLKAATEDPFFKTIPCLIGWPIDILPKYPQKSMFVFFKRKTIICKDTRDTPWIYIIKSGSCSLLKQLKTVHPTLGTKPPKPLSVLEKQRLKDEELNHKERMSNQMVEELVRIDKATDRTNNYEIQQLNIPVTKLAKRLKGETELDRIMAKFKQAVNVIQTFKSNLGTDVENDVDGNEAVSSKTTETESQEDQRKQEGEEDAAKEATTDVSKVTSNEIKMERTDTMMSLTSKGPFLLKTGTNLSLKTSTKDTKELENMNDESKVSTSDLTTEDPTVATASEATLESGSSNQNLPNKDLPNKDLPNKDLPEQSLTNKALPKEETIEAMTGSKSVRFMETSDNNDSDKKGGKKKATKPKKVNKAKTAKQPLSVQQSADQPCFVEVQTLTKGSVFGIAEFTCGPQPSFSLVSNGAECVLINKKFYLENVGQRLMNRLRDDVFPYPSDEYLQENLGLTINWDLHKHVAMQNTVGAINLKKANIHDARTSIKLPPVN